MDVHKADASADPVYINSSVRASYNTGADFPCPHRLAMPRPAHPRTIVHYINAVAGSLDRTGLQYYG